MVTIPTLQQLNDDAIAAIESELQVSISILPDAMENELRAEAAATAGRMWHMYKMLGKLQKNIFIDTAETEESGGTMQRFGRVKLGREPFAATQGYYEIEITGSIGAVIDANTIFIADDSSSNPGLLFALQEAYTLVATTDTITVVALTAGTAGALIVGDTLTCSTPLVNVDSAATVTAETTTPRDAEDLEDYRAKGLQAYRTEPQGGAAGDYRIWGYDAQGVQQIYPYVVSNEVNKINIFVESDSGDGTADSGLLQDVEDVMELDPDTTKDLSERQRRPMQVMLNIQSVAIKEIVIEFDNANILGTALSADEETTLEDALTEAIAQIRPFITGADILSEKNDTLGINNIINVALTALPGLFFDDVTMTVAGTPETSYTFNNGNIPHLDSVNYV